MSAQKFAKGNQLIPNQVYSIAQTNKYWLRASLHRGSRNVNFEATRNALFLELFTGVLGMQLPTLAPNRVRHAGHYSVPSKAPNLRTTLLVLHRMMRPIRDYGSEDFDTLAHLLYGASERTIALGSYHGSHVERCQVE